MPKLASEIDDYLCITVDVKVERVKSITKAIEQWRDAERAELVRELSELVNELQTSYNEYRGSEEKLYDEMLENGVPEDCPGAWGEIKGRKAAADALASLLSRRGMR